ncbi:hypothetical protein Ahy_B03g064918 [Arachis hypogaea]|uniref:Uroporphyrinogen decarboxylase (URO-D) domain-containing protein n=1 Tax=Arachis hypogaea TaxID=3818 RepID=A0A445A0I8_ARAHY|nr:hypothetical protein Ahy_B03g064918 [Arachis hypogaea]
MREEEVASVAAKPSLTGLGSPSPLSCVPLLASGSPLCFCSWSDHWQRKLVLLFKSSFQAARGELVSRPPACMMRQVGRYMAVYRKLAEKYPSFRERSETTNLIVEISLQPWNAFRPDGVIIFSNILTPLPAFGVEFDVEDVRGLVIQSPIRSEKGLKALHPIDLEKLSFVGDSLKILRKEVGGDAVILGFVGAPWTIATYIVEGSMCYTAPHLLRTLLSHLAQAIADYVIFQVESGAHCIQIFDSWGGQLPPDMWERWSKPYIKELLLKPRESTQAELTHQLY